MSVCRTSGPMWVICPMNSNASAMQSLAQRLIALEASRNVSTEPGGAAARACEVLRQSLARLVGVDGFRSLLSRSLAIAKTKASALDAVHVGPDGSLRGFEGIVGTEVVNAGSVIMAELLGLLVTFIGEPLTLRLVWDAWPEASVAELDAASGEQS